MNDNQLEILYNKHVIDNRKLSMLEAIRYLLNKRDNKTLNIAVGYFYISGMLLLKEEFVNFFDNRNGHLKILMGNETNSTTVNVLSGLGDKDYAEYINRKTVDDVNKISDKSFLSKVNQWIKQNKIEVKVYVGKANYFHAKSYLFALNLKVLDGTAIVGSSNFSTAGLKGNTELNFLTRDGYSALHEWFVKLWNSTEVTEFAPQLIKITSANLAKNSFQEYKPVKETYYEFANMFGKSYTELDESQEWVKNLFPHQKSGIINVKEKLDSFNSAVLSDGVGLGKTRTVAGVIKLYLTLQHTNNILIIADTKIKKQWREELKIVGVNPNQYEYISRQQLVNMPLKKLLKKKYTLIIVDEAHIGFKNNSTEAYQKLLEVKLGTPNVKGLMITATPWNNEREDVINIGSLFLNIDAIPQDRKYKQYFLSSTRLSNRVIKHLAQDNSAFKQFWSDIYLQRTRKTYGGEGVKFPQREFPSVNISYEPRKNDIFSTNFDRIADLKFPYQDPIKYVDDSREELSAKQFKMMLLKRADSSWVAFFKSLEHITDKLNKINEDFLLQIEKLSDREILSKFQQFLRKKYDIVEYKNKNELSLLSLSSSENIDNEEDRSLRSRIKKQRYIKRLENQIDNLTISKVKKAIRQMRIDCNDDLSILNDLKVKLKEAYLKNDQVIDEKINKIIECVNIERNKKHKIILVSQFADTVNYYYKYFYKYYNDKEISFPMGMITGDTDGKNTISCKLNDRISKKDDVLNHFSPKSKNTVQLINNESQINLVIATDTISTGQNLQDAVTIMNIDLPYNPMILEQRIGRIDRPISDKEDSKKIYIYTFPIYESINSQLRMMKRLGIKMEGVLRDTEFDNVVLPQYENYLNNILEKKANAVENMLKATENEQMYHSNYASEKHSEAYLKANKRMFDFKMKHLSPLKTPLIEKYSFSNGIANKSVIVIKILFYDINNSFLGSERIIVNPESKRSINITEAENDIYSEINYDVRSSNILDKNKAMLIVRDTKKCIHDVFKMAVDHYNKQQKNMKENLGSLNNKISKKAAQEIKESAQRNKSLVQEKLRSVNINPKELANIAKYISTIDVDDDLFEMVKDIANNPDMFWLNLRDYIKFFDTEKIKNAENVGKNIEKVNTRLADLNNSKYEVLTGNIVINN